MSYEMDLSRHYANIGARLRGTISKRSFRPPVPAPPKMMPSIGPPDDFIPAFLPVRELGPPRLPGGLPTWKRICIEVARKHGITLSELRSARRFIPLVVARHEAMFRMKKETSMSFPDIGRRLGGRDHTTVLHGIKRHEERMRAAAE